MVVPDRIIRSHRKWATMAVRLHIVLSVLGLCAVTSSVVVAVFTEELKVLGTRIVAAVSALCVGYLSFFHVQKKIDDLWRGWRHLNAAIVLYEAGKIDLEKLTSEYSHAEEMIGVMEANIDALPPNVSQQAKAGITSHAQWHSGRVLVARSVAVVLGR